MCRKGPQMASKRGPKIGPNGVRNGCPHFYTNNWEKHTFSYNVDPHGVTKIILIHCILQCFVMIALLGQTTCASPARHHTIIKKVPKIDTKWGPERTPKKTPTKAPQKGRKTCPKGTPKTIRNTTGAALWDILGPKTPCPDRLRAGGSLRARPRGPHLGPGGRQNTGTAINTTY